MSYFPVTYQALARRPEPAAPPVTMGLARSRHALRRWRWSLRERDERTAAMQREYVTLECGQRASAGAGAEQLGQLFKKLAAPLLNLAALAALPKRAGYRWTLTLATLFRGNEKQLKAAGLELLGDVGAPVSFDMAVHQRMSGGASPSDAGDDPHPRLPLGRKVLLKAMVTAKEIGA